MLGVLGVSWFSNPRLLFLVSASVQGDRQSPCFLDALVSAIQNAVATMRSAPGRKDRVKGFSRWAGVTGCDLLHPTAS